METLVTKIAEFLGANFDVEVLGAVVAFIALLLVVDWLLTSLGR